jgi:hypothetical protein
MASAVRIELQQPETKGGRDAFIQVPFELYKGDPNWVPPLLMERRDHFNPNKNPYFDHAKVALWTATRNGLPVGRISAQVCEMYLDRYADRTGHFGFLEAVDDEEVFSELIGCAASWLAGHGMERMIGPFSFSVNDECGLLVDGFDSAPALMMNYAPPFYAERLERAGFAGIKDLFAFEYGRELDLPRSLATMVQRAKKSGELQVRPFRKSKLNEDLDILVEIFNDAWADNWGFVPMTEGEVKALGANLKLLIRDEYGAIATYNGEPVAVAITLPNINEAIADLGGRLLPFGWAKILSRIKLRQPNSVRLPILGVRKKYQSGVIGAALAASVIDPIRSFHRDRGSQWGELSWVLEDNEAMLNLAKFTGATHYKTYRIYERAVSGPPAT